MIISHSEDHQDDIWFRVNLRTCNRMNDSKFTHLLPSSFFYCLFRYLILNPNKVNQGTWDEGLNIGNQCYSKRIHNICCDNCHSHVATCLNNMAYQGKTNWNMVTLCFWMFFRGSFISLDRTLITFMPFLVLVALYIFVSN